MYSLFYQQHHLLIRKEQYHDFIYHHTDRKNTERQRAYHLVKCGCSRWSKTMMMSPGSIPGSWSPSPWNTIFCPSFIPVVVTCPGEGGTTFGLMVNLQNSHIQIKRPVTLTFVDVDLQNLLLPHDLATSTCFAAVLVADPLSLALTALTHRGHLLNHTWYDLVHADLHACAMASRAHLCSSFPTPTTCQEK